MPSLVMTLSSERKHSIRRIYAFCLLFVFVSWSIVGLAASEDHLVELRQIAQLAEYIGVDYSEAVNDGQITDNGEYQEMLEFSSLITTKISRVAESFSKLQPIVHQAKSLQSSIQNKQSINTVRVLTAELRYSVLTLAPQSSLPTALMAIAKRQQMYENNCASCHGVTGQGDGIAAANLEPSPTDFTDKERALNRSILGLYDAIANGIDGTAMPAFAQLTDQQKWSLAFYVGSLAFQPSEQLLAQADPVISLQQLVNYSPTLLAKELPDKHINVVEQLRANPDSLFVAKSTPLTVTRERLKAAQSAYHMGEYDRAHNLTVSAYLDGFELVENNLDARNQALRKSIETTLIKLRHAISQPQNDPELDSVMSNAFNQLDQAERLLTESALSNGTLFSASLVILLREGLEALLVIIALTTVLIRTQRRDALKYVHAGWISALFAGGATWLVAQTLISISGASREVMEGVAAMLAAVVLFYVGIWMHDKTHAEQWQAYIQQHINTKLKSGTLWGLTALAFIAVYREVFETILFYQSLLTQSVDAQFSYVAGGFFLGTIILFVLAWVLIKYSIKLPIARFFATTTYLLLALSFVLMGKAVSALQEAAFIDISPLPVSFSIEWIGVNSTWQGVLSQALILLAFAVVILRSKVRRNSIRQA